MPQIYHFCDYIFEDSQLFQLAYFINIYMAKSITHYFSQYSIKKSTFDV